ncbi:MAG: YvcK family protein [Anaerolineales bacterium]|nr:YvcK family protein [Anaerolineales bacterium]
MSAKRIKRPPRRAEGQWERLKRWLEPGLGVKRWIVTLILATALIGLGVALLLLDIYRANPGSEFLAVLSLAVFPRWLRALLLGGFGLVILLVSIFRLSRALITPFLKPGDEVVEVVAAHRRRGRGPRIVAIGGGTGLSTLLRGLKQYSNNITAIVTVADDGGSSGRLRRSLGLPPPGDIRACIAALSHDEDLLTQLFQYRFRAGEELNGHSFGNLFIAALSGVTGSFDQGVLEAGRLLSIGGSVMPSTLVDVNLVAEKEPLTSDHEIRINGESRISDIPGRISRVELSPSAPPAYPGAINAILNADLVILGPGSLYTSVIPNILVPDIVGAIKATRAFRMFICNVANQPGETEGYNYKDHWQAIEDHAGPGLIDLMIINNYYEGRLPENVDWVKNGETQQMDVPVFKTDLIDYDKPWHHDSYKLAESIIDLLEERTGPLEMLPDNEELSADIIDISMHKGAYYGNKNRH